MSSCVLRLTPGSSAQSLLDLLVVVQVAVQYAIDGVVLVARLIEAVRSLRSSILLVYRLQNILHLNGLRSHHWVEQCQVRLSILRDLYRLCQALRDRDQVARLSVLTEINAATLIIW